MPSQYSLHNYVTGQSEQRSLPATDEEAVQYLPQTPVTQALYWVRRNDRGESPSGALLSTLTYVQHAAAASN